MQRPVAVFVDAHAGALQVVIQQARCRLHDGHVGLALQDDPHIHSTPGRTPYLAEEAAAVITELDAEASKSYIVDLTDIPIIVSAAGVLDAIHDGALIRLDSSTGMIHQGNARE